MSRNSHLIIGGTTKAGTTSLFIYLNDHPDICGSNVKETRFFLDPDYPLPAKYRYEDGLGHYNDYFNHCQQQVLSMEATPDYLYSPGTPRKIKESLPEVRLLFILRDPVERLISWYRFAKQIGQLPDETSLDQYVHLQIRQGEHGALAEQHMRALQQGRYSVFLAPYFDLFERDQICVLNYTDLKTDAAALMAEICRFAGADPSFYQDYGFQIFNPTQTMRSTRLNSIYRQLRESMRMRAHDKPRLHSMLRTMRRRFEPFLLRLNQRPDEPVTISESVRAVLDDFYGDEPAALARLLGQEQFSWQ